MGGRRRLARLIQTHRRGYRGPPAPCKAGNQACSPRAIPEGGDGPARNRQSGRKVEERGKGRFRKRLSVLTKHTRVENERGAQLTQAQNAFTTASVACRAMRQKRLAFPAWLLEVPRLSPSSHPFHQPLCLFGENPTRSVPAL